MKREEAIKILQSIGEQYCEITNITLAPRMDEIAEAIDMAIKALEQPEIVRCGECELKLVCCRTIRSEGRSNDDFCSCGRR